MSTSTTPSYDPAAAEPRREPRVSARALHNRALGQWGDEIAAQHLVEAGLVVLDRNWRCESGEIDLVLREGDVLVVCEVKTRTSDRYGSPLEAVGPAKAQRLRRLSAQWLAGHQARPREVRIDMVGVLVGTGGEPEVIHVRGIG